MAAEGVNFYGRVGLDVFSHYNKISEKDVDGEATLKSRGKVAPSVALEVTKDLDSNLELGLGLAYVSHGKRDFKIVDIEGVKAKNGLYTAVGVGVEYMNVTADLAYVFTGAKVKISDEGTSESFRANNSAIRLTVGYKFSI